MQLINDLLSPNAKLTCGFAKMKGIKMNPYEDIDWMLKNETAKPSSAANVSVPPLLKQQINAMNTSVNRIADVIYQAHFFKLTTKERNKISEIIADCIIESTKTH